MGSACWEQTPAADRWADTHIQQVTDRQTDSETAPPDAAVDSQWTRGVEGSEVGRQHVFSAVEAVQRRRRDAPWSQRAAGKTTRTGLSVSVRAASGLVRLCHGSTETTWVFLT